MQPSARRNPLRFLQNFFENCQEYLVNEVLSFKPNCVFTLGRPAHLLFRSILNDDQKIPDKMKDAFTGKFYKVRLNNFEFDYSPCLHMQTYRVAETYGSRVLEFKKGLKRYFSARAV